MNKEIEYLKKDWYAAFLYRALFNVVKNDNGLYKLQYDDIETWFDKKKFVPEIEIVDQEKFSQLIDELLSSDIMKLQERIFSPYNDSSIGTLRLNFAEATLNEPCNGTVSWNGLDDSFNYINYFGNPLLIVELLSLKIQSKDIPQDWLNLLEKHETLIKGKAFSFSDLIEMVRNKRGTLEISDMDDGIVKLVKKQKK